MESINLYFIPKRKTLDTEILIMADQIYYRIIKSELIQFATLTECYDPTKRLLQHNEMTVSFNPSTAVLSCSFSVILRDEDESPLLKATMLCGFEIKRESLDAITQNGVVKFSTNVLCHIASLTYSSMRGAISVKSEDTPFRGYVLPLSNVSEHIKSSASFKLGE